MSRHERGSSKILALVATTALAASFIALAKADDGDGSGAVLQRGEAADSIAEAEVTLGDLFIEPKPVVVPAGRVVLSVHNEGVLQHTLALTGTKKQTPLLEAGGKADLDLGALEPGDYQLVCTVPGHEAAGMKAELEVGEGAAGHEVAEAGRQAVSPAEMDEVMARRTKAFPAKTEGTGAQLLDPTVLPDGTKEFRLTTRVVRWELEPGKRVEAWTYNGVVPGPTIKVGVGDRVRVVLTNELSESTSIHFHGVRVPNALDGVPDITQPPVKPGESFTYEFTTREPAVGIYHSHHHADVQVPNGLFAPFIVGDLPLPSGARVDQEIPMVLNDAGTIGFSLNGKSFPATAPVVARPGEWVLVHYFNEGVQVHPMHLHGPDQLVIAKDGNALPQPYLADTVLVGPGERYSVLVHAEDPGVWAWHCHILPHAEREDGMFGMVTAMVIQ